jgi:fructose transport system ATP-binding protein
LTEQNPSAALPILPTLEGHGLVKTYGGVVALDHVDFAVYPGEVLAVVGDNGAGKSTLVRCLSGAEIPDAGTMRLDGGLIQFRTTREARLAGINAVYQSLKVDPAMDIVANLFRDREPSRPGPLGKVLAWMESNGLRRAASTFDSKVIILDEPTAALGERESLNVRKLIERLRGQGLPIVLVSHNIHQVFQIADRIHVQRLGARAAVVTRDRVSITDVVAIMSGALRLDENDQTPGPSS